MDESAANVANATFRNSEDLPQIVKLLKEKKAQDVSPVMYFVLLAGNALWCWYGLLINELPILVTNAFSVLCDIVMIILNYRYTKKSK